MLLASVSNLCWATGRQRRNQAIFGHLLQDTDGFEEGYFIHPPIVKIAKPFQFSRAPEFLAVAPPRHFNRPVTLLQPVLTLPVRYSAEVARKTAAELGQKLIEDVFRNRPYFLWIDSIAHFQAQIVERLMRSAQLRVFDSSDMMMMYERNADEDQIKLRSSILENSDVAICANEQVMASLNHPAKCLIPNCTEFSVFQTFDRNLTLAPLFPKPEGAIYVGFTGILTAERMDFDLLHAAMMRYPNYQFVFVGSTNRASLLARLKGYPNFHHIPNVSDHLLSSILNHLDVAIVPDLDNDYTRGSDMRTTLDYLACGIPVLSTPSGSAVELGDAIYVAGSVWEFLHILERLATKSRHHHPQPGLALAQQNSWCNRIPEFVDWLFERQREKSRIAHTADLRIAASERYS